MRVLLLRLAALAGCLLVASLAWTEDLRSPDLKVTVPANASIWRIYDFSEIEETPEDSAQEDLKPVAVDMAALGKPSRLSFQVRGASSRDPDREVVDADGETPELGRYMTLVGVFAGPDQLEGAPAFGDSARQTLETVAPKLNELFFVGDGLTGHGDGARQTFLVPEGAGTLYLAPFDCHHCSSNNTGELQVAVFKGGGEVVESDRAPKLASKHGELEAEADAPRWVDASASFSEPLRDVFSGELPSFSLDEAVERLRRSKAEYMGRVRAQGRAAGEVWAKNVAEYDQLRRLAELLERPDGLGSNPDAASLLVAASDAINGDFVLVLQRPPPANARFLDDREYVQAFMEGAKSIWDAVKDRL